MKADRLTVMGAFFMFGALFLEALGGFDERFFLFILKSSIFLTALPGRMDVFIGDAASAPCREGAAGTGESSTMFYSLLSRILYGYKNFAWHSSDWRADGHVLVSPTQ